MTTRLRIRRIPKPSGTGYWPGWILHEIGDLDLNSAEWFPSFPEARARADAQLTEATA